MNLFDAPLLFFDDHDVADANRLGERELNPGHEVLEHREADHDADHAGRRQQRRPERANLGVGRQDHPDRDETDKRVCNPPEDGDARLALSHLQVVLALDAVARDGDVLPQRDQRHDRPPKRGDREHACRVLDDVLHGLGQNELGDDDQDRKQRKHVGGRAPRATHDGLGERAVMHARPAPQAPIEQALEDDSDRSCAENPHHGDQGFCIVRR